MDAQKSCRADDPSVVFKTRPNGSSHFAGMLGNVALISDEEVRKSLFAYELPSGRELFVARNWEQGAVDAKSATLSFSVPAQANECETSLRAMDVNPTACRKRADEAVQCLRASAERYTKSPAKVEVAASKAGKDCRFRLPRALPVRGQQEGARAHRRGLRPRLQLVLGRMEPPTGPDSQAVGYVRGSRARR